MGLRFSIIKLIKGQEDSDLLFTKTLQNTDWKLMRMEKDGHVSVWWFKNQLRIKLQISGSTFLCPALVREGQKQRLRVEIIIYWKQSAMEWEIHSNSSNISNRNIQKSCTQKLCTQKVFTPQLSSTWPQRQGQDCGCCPQTVFPVPEPKPTKTRGNYPRCVTHFSDHWAQLWSAELRSSPAHFGSGLELSPSLSAHGCSLHQCRGTRALPWAHLGLALGLVVFPRDRKGWAAAEEGQNPQRWSWQLPQETNGRKWCIHFWTPLKAMPLSEEMLGIE